MIHHRLAYYWKRWRLDRKFRSEVQGVAFATFFRSFFDVQAALREGGRMYHQEVMARYYALRSLNERYQPYFKETLQITPAPDVGK